MALKAQDIKKGFKRQRKKIEREIRKRKLSDSVRTIKEELARYVFLGTLIDDMIHSGKLTDDDYVISLEPQKDLKVFLLSKDGLVPIINFNGDFSKVYVVDYDKAMEIREKHGTVTDGNVDMFIVQKVTDFMKEWLESIDDAIITFDWLLKNELSIKKGEKNGN